MTLNSPDKIFENPVRALKINLNHDNLRNVNRLNTELWARSSFFASLFRCFDKPPQVSAAFATNLFALEVRIF